MALGKKNTTVDTPFDNYKERQEERDRLLVNHIPESPIYMSQEGVFFLVSVVMALYQKCFSIKAGLIWSAVVVVVILFWSISVRFFVPKKDLAVNIFVNTLYTVLANVGAVTVLRMFHLFTIKPTDIMILIPLAIGFSMVSYNFHSEDYFDFMEDIIWPTLRSVITMVIVTLICSLLGINQIFVAPILAGIIILLMSKFLSVINKREFLFSPVPAYSIFRSVPNRNVYAFLRFFSYRVLLLIAMLVTTAAGFILCKLGNMKYIELSFLVPLLNTVIMGIFLILVDYIPYFKSEFKSTSRAARFMKYYEYPLISALMAIPFVCNYDVIKTFVYMVFLLALDVVFAGFMISLPRRLLFTRRVKVASGAPAILIILGLLDMALRILFVIY